MSRTVPLWLLLVGVSILGTTTACERIRALGGKPSASRSEAEPSPPKSNSDLATSDPAPPPSNAKDQSPPAGYVSMTVLRVVETPQGHAVILSTESKDRLLPIFIGGTEALSIDLRHAQRRYPRPLTHDLLDRLVDKLDGKLIKVHVDDLKDNVFVGRVFVQRGASVFDVDARPSDAIALAIGNRVPIYVSQKVVEVAGLRTEDVPDQDRLRVPEENLPSEPTRL